MAIYGRSHNMILIDRRNKKSCQDLRNRIPIWDIMDQNKGQFLEKMGCLNVLLLDIIAGNGLRSNKKEVVCSTKNYGVLKFSKCSSRSMIWLYGRSHNMILIGRSNRSRAKSFKIEYPSVQCLAIPCSIPKSQTDARRVKGVSRTTRNRPGSSTNGIDSEGPTDYHQDEP